LFGNVGGFLRSPAGNCVGEERPNDKGETQYCEVELGSAYAGLHIGRACSLPELAKLVFLFVCGLLAIDLLSNGLRISLGLAKGARPDGWIRVLGGIAWGIVGVLAVLKFAICDPT
jgi:hypothetical protein